MIEYKHIFNSVIFLTIIYSAAAQTTQQPLYKNKEFALYADSVVQGGFTGKALSRTQLTSNYKSPANAFLSPALTFKFSINGKDNEMVSGKDHQFICLDDGGTCETPLIKFGQQYKDDRSVPDNTFLKPQTALKLRLDMRDVLKAFEEDGFYTTFSGDKIYKQDFKGVYVAGGTAPLSWDFDNLVNKPELILEDNDGDGIYISTLVLNNPKDEKGTAATWQATKNVIAFPQYKSDYPLADAVYAMSIEEMVNAVEPDSTFRTGKEWAGVWTRDISYSIILSMAYLQPQVSKYSLLRKVSKDGKIIQDTGTGGAWPVSTDRMVWAIAAWELYKATGDEDWLKKAYSIIKASIEDDLKVAYDETTGLMKGESSFLDWREQTYPKWMQPVDIYESECLGTNAVHYGANKVAAAMAKLLGFTADANKYNLVAENIKKGINQYLWIGEKGYYGQFLYGRHAKILSPRAEALGEALTVLFDIADESTSAKVIANTPLMDFGIPSIYPQIPNIPPYHNNGIWPFVQSYWAMAAAKMCNEAAVMHSIAAIYRPAALWVTNKENFVASNGDFAGTQINSSNMLWSLSGNIALVHKILFGISYEPDGLLFCPFVPFELKGKRSLSNFKLRDAVFNIEMEGYGNEIKSFELDGKRSGAKLPYNLKGVHNVKIILAEKRPEAKAINMVPHYVTLPAPAVTLGGKMLSWNNVDGATQYKVVKNGAALATVSTPEYSIKDADFGEYVVFAVDANGVESFGSEPVVFTGNKFVTTIEVEGTNKKSDLSYRGFSGAGFVEVSKTINTAITIPVTVPEDGTYTIDVKYANGNGPTNTENKCAIRTLKKDNLVLGTLVLPQRGKEEWSNWGWSNAVPVLLTKGTHNLTISLEPYNNNMNDEINQAMLDQIRVIKVK